MHCLFAFPKVISSKALARSCLVAALLVVLQQHWALDLIVVLVGGWLRIGLLQLAMQGQFGSLVVKHALDSELWFARPCTDLVCWHI